MTLDELRQRLASLNEDATQIRARAEDEKRDLTTEETADLDALLAGFDRTKKDIDRLTLLEEQTKTITEGLGRKTEPEQPQTLTVAPDGDDAARVSARKSKRETGTSDKVPAQYFSHPKNWGYESFGQFAFDIRMAAKKEAPFVSNRLSHAAKLAAASTYSSEQSGGDGGFAVPPEFRTAILEKVMGEESLVGRCDQITTGGNSFTFPKDETTPWQTSGGVLAYWENEASAATQSKVSLEQETLKLNKIRALVTVTEELLEDAPGLDSYLRRKAPAKINFKVNLAILQGIGAGQPLGILNSPALVTVSKESGQQADTIVGNNILKMYSRMPAANRSNAVWLINQDIEPMLYKLTVAGTDNTGNAATSWGTFVYMPPNGLVSSPYGSLLGRPVIPTQGCETLGDAGDILFVDLQQYLVLLKSGNNPRVDTSMHLWFDQDLMAYKFTLRIGGMPWWGSAMSARDGSATYSPYVALEAR